MTATVTRRTHRRRARRSPVEDVRVAMGGNDRAALFTVVPLASAITLFGAVYGAAARPVFGAAATLATSAFIFSGAVQFTVAGLALGGAAPLALVAAAALVNTRNIALGAVLRPHLHGKPLRRAGLACFLIDETVGLALAQRERAAWMLATAGTVCYVAWFAGTLAGVIGGGVVPGVADLAAAVFPVLFVGLAAMATTSATLAWRAVAAAVLTLALAIAWPGGRALAPVVAAVVVALPGERSKEATRTGRHGGGTADEEDRERQ